MGQTDEVGQQPRGGGLDVPSFTERGDGGSVDDGNDHLRVQRTVKLAQHPAQSGVESLTALAVGLFDRGGLAG